MINEDIGSYFCGYQWKLCLRYYSIKKRKIKKFAAFSGRKFRIIFSLRILLCICSILYSIQIVCCLYG